MADLRSRILMAALPALALFPAVAAAEPASPLDLRVGKLEKEMHAVQRTVFPQGAPVEPEFSSATPPAGGTGSTAGTPLADLTARVDALERQVATLTGASEQNTNRVRQLESALAAVQSRLSALDGGGAGARPATDAPAPRTPPPGTPAPGTPANATSAGAPRSAGPAHVDAAPKPSAPVRADPARKAAVAAVELPSTGDAAEDAYTYGFRLYMAKLYPEAEAKLKAFTEANPPTQKRWSYAKNLLGRAYLDEGKPALASVAFYDNYQKAPRGERAADSLTWLGQALIKLKKLPDACKVFDELNDVYGTRLTADQRSRAAKGRVDAKCTAA